jgi:hypothetical protein
MRQEQLDRNRIPGQLSERAIDRGPARFPPPMENSIGSPSASEPRADKPGNERGMFENNVFGTADDFSKCRRPCNAPVIITAG